MIMYVSFSIFWLQLKDLYSFFQYVLIIAKGFIQRTRILSVQTMWGVVNLYDYYDHLFIYFDHSNAAKFFDVTACILTNVGCNLTKIQEVINMNQESDIDIYILSQHWNDQD